jgi:FkbM family methyltransferase
VGKVAEIKVSSGVTLHVNPSEPRGQALIDCGGNFNPKSVVLWNTLLEKRNWANLVDVGVNYGEMLAWANLPKGAKLYGFEPNPTILPWLRKTVEGLPFSVNLIEAAVSDRPRESVEFQVDTVWSGTSKLAMVPSESGANAEADSPERFRSVSVPCVSIDSVIGPQLRSGFVMKIDVEGHEAAVLRGAASAFRNAKEWAVMFEILHMRVRQLARISLRHRLYLFNSDAQTFVRAPRFNIFKLRAMRLDKRFYQQDAVLVSSGKVLRAQR